MTSHFCVLTQEDEALHYPPNGPLRYSYKSKVNYLRLFFSLTAVLAWPLFINMESQDFLLEISSTRLENFTTGSVCFTLHRADLNLSIPYWSLDPAKSRSTPGLTQKKKRRKKSLRLHYLFWGTFFLSSLFSRDMCHSTCIIPSFM